MFFDVEKDETSGPEYLFYLLNKINKFFPHGDPAISGSITNKKTSYHITLNNYMITKKDERKTMKALVKEWKKDEDGFDYCVYSKNRHMKLINQSKTDKRIQAIIQNEDPQKHIITCFFNESPLPFPEFEITQPEVALKIKIEKAKAPFDVGSLPKLKCIVPETFEINNATPIEILSLIPLDKSFPHNYTHLICRYCFFHGLTFDHFISWYSKKATTSESVNKWRYHWSNIKHFPEVSRATVLSLLVKFYPQLKRKKGYDLFKDQFELSEDKINKTDRLSPNEFNTDDKFICINTGMGSGKTAQTIDYLVNKESFIWLTPLISLAQNTKQRLKNKNIDFKYYKDIKQEEKHSTLSSYDRMVICINSLFYTQNKTYDICIIDEIETLLMKWFNNDTLNKSITKDECWLNFLSIIRNAKKVIFLDAFTSKLTINFIEQLKAQGEQYKITELTNYSVNRSVYYWDTFLNWKKDIIDHVNKGEKLFIFYPQKNKRCKLPSMKDLHTILEKATNTKGVYYNADSDDAFLKELEDVNENWSNKDLKFVICNTKITVGLNYEYHDFDSVYLSVAGFNLARDIVQVSMRCRYLKANKINVVLLDKLNKIDNYEGDSYIVNDCPIYNNLVKDLLIEKQAPLQQSLTFLFQKAGYKINTTPKTMKDNLETYFKELYESCNLAYTYETIADINENEVMEAQQRIYSAEATVRRTDGTFIHKNTKIK